MAHKRKPYIPNHRYNPVVQAKRIDSLSSDLKDMQNVLQTVIDTYEKHMEHLSNFASHNMGNAVQSMYASLVKSGESSLTSELKASVNNLNSILESFKQMVACTHDKEFSLKEIMIAIETLTRSTCHLNKIEVKYDYDKTSTEQIKLPFQSLLQVLHNLISNSIKALNKVDEQKRILITAFAGDGVCRFSVKDNGIGVPNENVDKIFDYKFTTTESGSGIGLFYARYIVQHLNGQITLNRFEGDFSTIFNITIPYGNDKANISN